jgi:2-keto-4-pentenoate hydratase/2-oxohepta-3-ene-1,7-dioic acid hydratase in catechol pathway
MRLRRRLTESGPRVEAASGSGDWLALDAVRRLPELMADHGVAGDGASDALPVLQLGPSGWKALAAELAATPSQPPPDGPLLTPFAPRSFRDFMLYEQHAIDAARGLARRFLPAAYRLARIVEAMTRRPFPAFRPHRLWYAQPIYYFGNHLNFLADGEEIPWPSYASALDYELELGAALAHPLRDASPQEAEAAIGGFVVLNDLSVRNVQLAEMRSGFGPQKSKHFASAMSAEIVTADEILPRQNALTGGVSINGRQIARCSTQNPGYTLAEAIAFASKDETLHAGELFGSGTLPGGSGMETGAWLQPGDRLTMVIDGVGDISATVGKRRLPS